MGDFQMAIEALEAEYDLGIRDFSMEYLEVSGRRWGAASEWETRLNILGRGDAGLFRRRSPDDSAQTPPGRFSGIISDAELRKLLGALSASGIQTYRAEAPGPLDPVSRLSVRIGKKIFEFAWGISRQPAPPEMAELEALLIQWTFDACPNPRWSLELTAQDIRLNGQNFSARMQLQNRGQESIHILDPASRGIGLDFGMALRYGEVPLIEEGFTPEPIEWQSTGFRWPSLGRPELLELRPGHPVSWDLSTELVGTAPRGWIGRLFFRHYLAGDLLAGMPVFNGALFTDDLKW